MRFICSSTQLQGWSNNMKSSNFTSITCLQNHNFGALDGFQSTTSEFSTIMGNSNINGYGAAIENDYMQQLGYGNMDLPSQFSYTSPVTCSSMMPTPMENLSLAPSPPHLVDYKWSFPCHDDSNKSDFVLPQSYKPTIKDVKKCVTGAQLAQRNGALSSRASLDASKKRKMIEQFVDARKFQMQAPMKRSQKLSDKISALQELVSPYGKTDTASVLQEACIYIKIIHQEIRRLSISYLEVRSSFQAHLQGEAERQSDLQSKGLCLVPVSIMKSISRESWGAADHQTVTRPLRRAGNI